MAQHLTQELADTAAGELIRKAGRAARQYKMGCLSDFEYRSAMFQILDDGFWRLLRDNCLRLQIRENNYAQFAEECRTVREGGDFSPEPDSIPWLLDTEPLRPCGASPGDRQLVLSLLKQIRLPPEYFAPLPEAVPSPDLHELHRWHDGAAFGTNFRCTEDGGLLSDPAPVGKTFTLVSGLGLKAVLTVREDRRAGARTGLDFDEQILRTDRGSAAVKAEFLAEGTIEGYTAPLRTGNPDVLIRTSGGKVSWLAWYANSDDEKAEKTFPLWQAFYRADHERSEKREDPLTAWFAAVGGAADGD